MEQWQARQTEFTQNWRTIVASRRVEVHIPSISAPLDVRLRVTNRRVRESSQLSRLCGVADPLVDVVYVSPIVLPDTVLAYYKKLIEVGIDADCKRVMGSR